MNISDILRTVPLSPSSKTVKELVHLNETTKERGLELSTNEVKTLLTARNKVLHDHARIELSTDVLKELISVFSASPYIDQAHYVATLNELQEIFYYLKNETEDKMADKMLIQQMSDYYNTDCAGSLELLRSKTERFAEDFRMDLLRIDSCWKGDE
ncbi:DUF6323 family protein [Gracilibacillus timonensis]|uniref:DUF6323 family protein n=1 Tax=Gracilibacillus timonensis TaxID=1816696 RepID=UPI0008262CE7|nr:DUF6323 family protein [Gracilibacillus timonensis]